MNDPTLDDVAARLAELLVPRLVAAFQARQGPGVPRWAVEVAVSTYAALGPVVFTVNDLKLLRLVEARKAHSLGHHLGSLADDQVSIDGDLRVARVGSSSGRRGNRYRLTRGVDACLSQHPAAGIVEALKLWGQR